MGCRASIGGADRAALPVQPPRRSVAAAGALLLALVVAGCSPANSTRLPELAGLPRRVLSTEEQQKAVEAMKSRQETHRAEAIKEIESAKNQQ